jgi:hypothetical protein
LDNLQNGVESLYDFLQSLRKQLRDPYLELVSRTKLLERCQITTQLLRQVLRFMSLSKKLRQQIKTQGDHSAAESLYQLEKLRNQGDFKGIDIVDAEIEWILKARQTLLEKGHRYLMTGCSSQNQSDTAKACQIFYHLHTLNKVIYTTCVKSQEKILQVISRSLQSLPGMIEIENKKSTDTSRIWKQLGLLFQELHKHTLQLLHLQRVLQKVPHPRDSNRTLWHAISFRDVPRWISPIEDEEEVGDSGENTLEGSDLICPFWEKTCRHFSVEFNDMITRHTALFSILVNEYPRLLRLMFDFLQRLETHQDIQPLHVGVLPSRLENIFKQEGLRNELLNTVKVCIQPYFRRIASGLEKILKDMPLLSNTQQLNKMGHSKTMHLTSLFVMTLKSHMDTICYHDRTKFTLLGSLWGLSARSLNSIFCEKILHFLSNFNSSSFSEVDTVDDQLQFVLSSIYSSAQYIKQEMHLLFSQHGVGLFTQKSFEFNVDISIDDCDKNAIKSMVVRLQRIIDIIDKVTIDQKTK